MMASFGESRTRRGGVLGQGFGLSLSLSGVDEMVAKLDYLGKKLALAAVRKGLRAGAKYLLPFVQANVPVKTGELRASLRVRSGRKRGEPGMLVTSFAGWFKGETYYGGFIEWGHDVKRTKHGPVLGHAAGEHFALYAIEEHGQEAAEIAAIETLGAIDAAIQGKALTAGMMREVA